MPASHTPPNMRRRSYPRPVTQRPPDQATLTFLPPDLLPALAEEAGASEESLSTLTVPSGTDLYCAITEYAVLASPRAPLFSDSVEGYSSSSSDDEERPARQRYRMRNRSPSPRRHPVTPEFRLALGFAHITWPPPKLLSAEVLALNDGNHPVKSSPTRTRENVKNTKTGQKPFALHLANYAICSPNLFNTWRELLVATTEGPDALKKFAKEVCTWDFERCGEKPERKDRFMFFRFYGKWTLEGWKRSRAVSNVVLRSGMMKEILDDVGRFLSPETKQWYNSHGIPQRRCYLFHGLPGTGKTSTIRVIASKFNLSCCYLNLTIPQIDNETLAHAFRSLPERAMIVIEDADALFDVDRENKSAGQFTFSGVLNALDGLLSADGVITILTTNQLEKLDKMLIRHGRVDKRFHFDRPTEEQFRQIFRSFYPDTQSSVEEQFVRAVMDRKEEEAKSLSTLQEMFIKMRGSTAEECAAGVSEFFEGYLPRDEGQRFLYV